MLIVDPCGACREEIRILSPNYPELSRVAVVIDVGGAVMFADLKDKRVVVTAGAAGIGRAVAEAFLEARARVHVCDVDAEALAAFSAARPAVGVSRADVADADQVARLFAEALERLGGLDVLVNNAGIAGPVAPIEAIEPADWRRTMAVNLDGQFLCLRHAVPALKRAGGGCLVNIASTAGLMGYPLRTPYAASKWAVVGLSKSLAMELGEAGIRVNAVCPGSVEGARMDRVIAAEARARGVDAASVRRAYTRQNALDTFIDAADVAALVLFLCSAAGGRITGQALSVDGAITSLAE
jgi:NAD(P)-dependent dehydrogenase (short-subunit alcohol dehydrogenase family)